MEKSYKAYKRIGKLKKKILEMVDRPIDASVYIDKNISGHIKRKHGKQLTRRIKKNLLWIIESILKTPDYVSIEKMQDDITLKLVKKFEVDIVLVVQLDRKEGYFYVATMYPLKALRVEEKVYRGDLKTLVDKNA